MTNPVLETRNIVSRSGFANPITLALTAEEEDDIQVYADDELLSPGTDYIIDDLDTVSVTIIGADDVDNYVGYETFTLAYNPALTQDNDLSGGGQFGVAFERAIDSQNQKLQAISDRLDRALTVPPYIEGPVTTETPVDGQVPVWNEDLQKFTWAETPAQSAAFAAAAAESAAEAAADAAQVAADAAQAATDAADAATARAAAEAAQTAAETAQTAAEAAQAAAAASASAAATSASGASTSATAAAASASAAATSATNAADSASAAATSATNASNSATAAATSATNAGNSATAAATSATNAANSAAAAAAIVAGFSAFWLTVVGAASAAASWLLLNVTGHLTSRTLIKALVPQAGMAVYLNEGLRSGMFIWRTGDYSAEIARDTQEGVYLKANSVASSAGAWVREGVGQNAVLNVLWFGADPTYTSDSANAIKGARAVLEYDSDYRGGVIYIPKGRYKVNSTIAFTYYAAGVVHNIYVRGDGPQATVLDFSAASAGSDGISFGKGVHFGVRDLTIVGAPQHNLVARGGAISGNDFCSLGEFKNLRLQSAGTGFGFRAENAWGLTLANIWSFNNGAGGFKFAGFHTHLHVSKCYAMGHTTTVGWEINAVIYSTFIDCAADLNRYGYALYNLRGVSFINCGAEEQGRETWLIRTSDALSTSVLTAVQDIRGVTFQGCYVLNGSTDGVGLYGAFHFITANSRSIYATIDSCVVIAASGSDVAVHYEAASGQIRTEERNNNFQGLYSENGSSSLVLPSGRTLSGTPSMAGTTSAGTGTYSVRTVDWTLTDGWCTFTASMTWSAHTGTGGLKVVLPAAMPAIVGDHPAAIYFSNLTYSGQLFAACANGGRDITLAVVAAGGGAAALLSMDTAGQIIVSGRYRYS